MPSLSNLISEKIWADIDKNECFPEKRVLLSHYTSVQVVKDILTSKKLWLANPLLMNDSEELRFGVLEGAKAFFESEAVRKAGKNRGCYEELIHSFSGFMAQLGTQDAFDVYIFCFSEHNPDDYDGKLSMWRGYGSNGAGAALVFDTHKIDPVDDSPLTIAPVFYATKEERLEWINRKIDELSELIEDNNFEKSCTHELAWHFFARLLVFSLHTKHKGFEEEQEWRLVYIRKFDDEALADSMLDYFIGQHGVEPKLKLDLKSAPGLISESFNIEDTIDRIILGPTAASPLSQKAFIRMLEKLDLEKLEEKTHASNIPYRSR